MKTTQVSGRRLQVSDARLAEEAVRALKAAADPQRAAQLRGYFKSHEEVQFYGLSMPAVRRIEKDLFARVRGVWTIDEATAFCDRLIRRPQLESKTTGLLLLARYRKSFDKALAQRAERWLRQGHCGNWAATDEISTLIIARLLRRFPDLLPRIQGWTGASNLWMRRAAAVSLVPLARRGERLDEAYAVARLLFPYPEDLIHKAAGWLLREAGKADAARLQAFLLAHGPNLPRTTLRYAIERFPAVVRQQLLAETRAAQAVWQSSLG